MTGAAVSIDVTDLLRDRRGQASSSVVSDGSRAYEQPLLVAWRTRKRPFANFTFHAVLAAIAAIAATSAGA